MQEMIDVRVATNGRMLLPRSVRNALGVTGAGVVILSVDGDEVKLSSMRQSIEERRIEADQDQAADEQN
jgi:bifunctional DNA-binding transcriptional regulator/antitoxin component of YhaV-PrlF toxin-antitoxin module